MNTRQKTALRAIVTNLSKDNNIIELYNQKSNGMCLRRTLIEALEKLFDNMESICLDREWLEVRSLKSGPYLIDLDKCYFAAISYISSL